MTDSPTRLADRLRTEGQKTLEFFYQLPEAVWQDQIYTEGSCWTIHHILVHFVSAEIAFGKLIRDISQGGTGASPDFDINRFNESQVSRMAHQSRVELLSQFDQSREANICLVENMPPGDLERVGRHPFLGNAPLEEIIKLLYRHNQIHQREIRKTLGEFVQGNSL